MKTEYDKGRIYPNSVPEFKLIQEENGSTVMYVRYRNDPVGYCSKWNTVNIENKHD